jgi:hypothetical protein
VQVRGERDTVGAEHADRGRAAYGERRDRIDHGVDGRRVRAHEFVRERALIDITDARGIRRFRCRPPHYFERHERAGSQRATRRPA